MRPLTKREREVLVFLADHDDDDEGELVYERGRAYMGHTPIAGRTVNNLIRLMALRGEDYGGTVERYKINETGLGLIGRTRKQP